MLKLIKEWCSNLSIKFNKTKVNAFAEYYCVTHNEVVLPDYRCPQHHCEYPSDSEEEYDSDGDCEIEDDYKYKQTKIIIHDEKHKGTFEELNFEWKDEYVDGGYIPHYN